MNLDPDDTADEALWIAILTVGTPATIVLLIAAAAVWWLA